MIFEPFLLRAIAAGVGLAIVAAPLGAVLIWNRMAYFGETIAQASLVGVALGLMWQMDVTLSVIVTTLAVAGLLIVLGRQKAVPLDAILGLTHHGMLALGIVATALLAGPSVDLMGYLFGDVFSVSDADLIWVAAGGAAVLAVMTWLWPSLVRIAVNDELATAEGVPVGRVKALFVLVLAVAVAVAIKIVGVLLAIAFLIVPIVAARPFASTPERLVLFAQAIGVASVIGGLMLSANADVPGGPSIVLVMALIAGASLAFAGREAR
ncbi:MAG: metal ABC transporter permease [Hyphomicrobium sp.]|nr:metal ABC transporter permease [Hyphomicrobium sp.]